MLLNKKISGRDRKCCDIGGIGLAKLIIKREKSMMGAALAMNCYDGDTLLCRVKNGKEEICYAADGVIYFSCALPHNNRSDVLKIDTTRREEGPHHGETALAAAGNHTRGDVRNRGKLPDGISVLRRKKENAAGIPV